MKKRILTGDRTTGKLHLGHYVGSLQSRVNLQHEYDTFILMADIQALTTHFENPALIHQSILEVAMDNLSVGLDPNVVTFVQQSAVSSIAELTIFYSMLVSVNTLRHNPTIKTEASQYGYDDMTYGFLGYPVSQTADITFCNAHLVPVGEDQAPHLELTRKIVRRFNSMYAPVLVEPQIMLSRCPRLIGLDGNAIYLSDDRDTVHKKVMNALTDKSRLQKTDPGHPEVCTVSAYHKAFNPDEYDNVCDLCRKGAIGCVACKKNLSGVLNGMMDPFRERRAYYESHLDEVKEIIRSGSQKANEIGNETVRQVKEAMNVIIK